MHPTPVYVFIHLIRSYRLQNKPNQTECVEETSCDLAKEAPAATTILHCASEGAPKPPQELTQNHPAGCNQQVQGMKQRGEVRHGAQ